MLSAANGSTAGGAALAIASLVCEVKLAAACCCSLFGAGEHWAIAIKVITMTAAMPHPAEPLFGFDAPALVISNLANSSRMLMLSAEEIFFASNLLLWCYAPLPEAENSD
jgi:hypothetical protein